MASQWNQQCAYCIGTRSFPIVKSNGLVSVRPSVRTCFLGLLYSPISDRFAVDFHSKGLFGAHELN